MIIFCTVFKYPLQKTAHCIVRTVIGDSHFPDSHLGGLFSLQDGEHLVKRTLVAEADCHILLQVESHEREVALQASALQVKDI